MIPSLLANAGASTLAKDSGCMASDLIISYDGTPNDDDALELGKMLAGGGASLALAYVRHSREFDPQREQLAQHDAERRLEHGAAALDGSQVSEHVIVNASTGDGLAKLSADEGASAIVFGSDYRTPPGRPEPGTSAQHLLEGGAVAVAIAAAGLRSQSPGAIRTIAVPLAGPTNEVARETARALAQTLGATVVDSAAGDVDLIVVGSQPGAAEGHIVVGGDVRGELSRARASVLVLPAGRPLRI
jgi:nucleotide-binding universal stress UspA family protein